MRAHRPTRSVAWRVPQPGAAAQLESAESPLSTDEQRPVREVGSLGRQSRGGGVSAATPVRARPSRRPVKAVHVGQVDARPAPAASPAATAAHRCARRTPGPADGRTVRNAKLQLERVQLALSARMRSLASQSPPCTTPDAATSAPQGSAIVDEHEVMSAAQAALQAERAQFEEQKRTAMSELENATLTIQELEERVVASELAVGRTEASEQELHQRLTYEQERRTMLEAELARLHTQLANDHVALDEANGSEAAVAMQLAVVEAESKRRQSEADRALAAATTELARVREKTEKRVAAARREAEEASRDAKLELQRRVREMQSFADSRVAAARRQGDYYRLEAETLNLTLGFRSPNGTALHRHGHLPAPEDTFGEIFSKTPSRTTSLPHSELRLPRSRRSSAAGRESPDAALRELQANKAKLEEDLEALQRQLTLERANAATAGRTNAASTENVQAAIVETQTITEDKEAVEQRSGPLSTTAINQTSASLPVSIVRDGVHLPQSSSDGETEEDDPVDVHTLVVAGRSHSEIRNVPEQHDQSRIPANAPADKGATRSAQYDLDSLDEVITAPASHDEVHAYAREIGLDPDDPDHAELLWIAREGLDNPLTSAWKPCQSPDGKRYYFNFDTAESSWGHPDTDRHKRLVFEHKRKISESTRAQSQRLETVETKARSPSTTHTRSRVTLETTFDDLAGGTPAPRMRHEGATFAPQRASAGGIQANSARMSVDYEAHDKSTKESSNAAAYTTSDASDFPHAGAQQLDCDLYERPRIRCLSAQTVYSTLNEPHKNIGTAQVGSIFAVLEISRDQTGLYKARSPSGWLAMLNGVETSLVVELLGPLEAWVDVAGYADFVEWAQSANQARAEADAAARNARILDAAITTMQSGILVVKYNRGVGGANNRMLWLSDDFTTLRWADESRLAKSNRKLNKSGTPTREREATNLALKSVVDVEYGYGRDASPIFKKHGFPADPWLCFTIRTADRTFDFSASSSRHARAAVIAISHASGDGGPLPPGMVGSMMWMAARWHLHDRWSQQGHDNTWLNGDASERKKMLADFLFEYAAKTMESKRWPAEGEARSELQSESVLQQSSIGCGATRASRAHGADIAFSPGVRV